MLFSPEHGTNLKMKAEPSEAEVEYAGISEYEQLRLENIKRNEEVYYH